MKSRAPTKEVRKVCNQPRHMDKYRYNGQRALPFRQQLRHLCRSDTKLGSALLAAIALCVYGFLGVLGFHILQLEPGWSLVNAVYFSTATCATVGYGDLYPSSAASRIFTIVMMVVGVGLVFPVFASGVARVQLYSSIPLVSAAVLRSSGYFLSGRLISTLTATRTFTSQVPA